MPNLVVFNAGMRARGSIAELDVEKVKRAWLVGGYGGFLVGQQAAQRMLPLGKGTIVFTGATASVKGYAESAPFAMTKFSLRGLAESMARELAPKGIHVAQSSSTEELRRATRRTMPTKQPIVGLIPMQLRRRICNRIVSTVARGRGRLKCGRSWKNSD